MDSGKVQKEKQRYCFLEMQANALPNKARTLSSTNNEPLFPPLAERDPKLKF